MIRLPQLLSLTLLVMGLCLPLSAHSQITFKHYYLNLFEDEAIDVEELPNGDFLVLSNGNDTTYWNYGCSLLRLDELGQIKTKYFYNDSANSVSHVHGLVKAPNHTYYVVSWNWIAKIDSNGALLNQVAVQPPYPGVFRDYFAEPTPSGNLLTVRRYIDSLWIEEYDPQLNFVQGRSFKSSTYSNVFVNDMAIGPNGNILIAASDGSSEGALIMLDPGLNILWARKLVSGAWNFWVEVVFDTFGDIALIVGEDDPYSLLNIIALESNGAAKWRLRFDTGFDLFPTSMSQTTNGWIIANSTYGNDNGTMLSMDRFGNLNWAWQYENGMQNIIAGNALMSGGVLMLATRSAPGQPAHHGDLLMIRTDNIGFLDCSVQTLPITVQIKDTAIFQPISFSAFPHQPVMSPATIVAAEQAIAQLPECLDVKMEEAVPTIGLLCSPNPVSDHLKVEFPTPGAYQIRILDMFGRSVLVTESDLKTCELALGHLPQGGYILQAISDTGESFVQRIVIR